MDLNHESLYHICIILPNDHFKFPHADRKKYTVCKDFFHMEYTDKKESEVTNKYCHKHEEIINILWSRWNTCIYAGITLSESTSDLPYLKCANIFKQHLATHM